MTAERLIELLGLTPHPEEGGFFRETYRSAASIEPGGIFEGSRSHSTAIYYLLTPDTYSALHRLPGPGLRYGCVRPPPGLSDAASLDLAATASGYLRH